MKKIFIQYKVGFIITIIVFVILMSFTTVRFMKAENSVKLAINEKIQNFSDNDINDAGWNIPEINQKKKEVQWVEQQLLLAKSDSLNLGINLADSIFQVQLKGTVLLQANILKQIPTHFIESPNYAAYLDFTAISKIVEEQSNIIKRPVKKVQAPKNENELAAVKHDTIPDPLLKWQFVLDNKIEVVITGVGLNKDSLIDIQYNNDILRYSVERLNKNWLPKTYIPTLYIWLNDKDAKAIYRAIPKNGKVIFKI
jgi:hypothetical protein